MNLPSSSLAIEALRKRLLYRSARRGMRELDLLLGKWAEAQLASLSEPELKAYQQILELSEPALWHFLREPTASTPDGLDPTAQTLLKRIRADSQAQAQK